MEDIKFSHDELINLVPAAMFGDRSSIEESMEYAELIAKASESYIHAITPWFVLYNTIAKKYYLIPKETVDNGK
jgi:hypothetical protein